MRHPYVALSYLWGKSRLIRVINNRLPTQVPNVIEDAMSVTKALGFRYLWVDQFCIDQQDSDRKIVEIRKMNMIYNTAELTIVAAAGSDADYGLPGIGNRPRKLQFDGSANR